MVSSRLVNVNVHKGVQCNLCKVSPIVGNRYKCTVCYDFDLCDSCEAATIESHAHPMIKHRVDASDPINTFQSNISNNNNLIECGMVNVNKPLLLEDILKVSPVSSVCPEKEKYRYRLRELRSTFDLKNITDDAILSALVKTNGNFDEAFKFLF